MNHRQVIIPFSEALRGDCRWCGFEIVDNGKRNNRKRWHQECVDKYNLLRFPHSYMNRHFDCCAICKANGSEIPNRPGKYGWSFSPFDIDHVVPLIDGGSFELENLQLLCWQCHLKKTKQEAKNRISKELRND